MKSATVIQIGPVRERSRRVARAIDARRRLHDAATTARRPDDARGGRAWLNGSELGGGVRATLAHLGEIYD